MRGVGRDKALSFGEEVAAMSGYSCQRGLNRVPLLVMSN